MDIKTLKAESRDPHGTRAVKRMRRQGRIPGIIYGHKQTPLAIALDRHELERELEQGVHLVQVAIGPKTETCLIKEVQYDHLGMATLHIDFTRVDLSERVKVKVPIELRGHAKGQTDGGVVSQQIMDLEVECLVTAIPESIRVPIADLALNQMIHVREITLPQGVTALADPEAIVVMCREALEVEAAAPVEGAEVAKEPEIIAKGKIDEEGAEGAEAKPAKDAKPAKEEKKEKK